MYIWTYEYFWVHAYVLFCDEMSQFPYTSKNVGFLLEDLATPSVLLATHRSHTQWANFSSWHSIYMILSYIYPFPVCICKSLLRSCHTFVHCQRASVNHFYAREAYIMHFLEATWFPNALVLAGPKVNFTLRPAKSADTYFTPCNLLYSPQKSTV